MMGLIVAGGGLKSGRTGRRVTSDDNSRNGALQTANTTSRIANRRRCKKVGSLVRSPVTVTTARIGNDAWTELTAKTVATGKVCAG